MSCCKKFYICLEVQRAVYKGYFRCWM